MPDKPPKPLRLGFAGFEDSPAASGGRRRRDPRPVHSQLPIRKLWGPAIPKEMVKDQAEQAFYRTAGELLGPAIEAQLTSQFIPVTGPS